MIYIFFLKYDIYMQPLQPVIFDGKENKSEFVS